MEKMLEKLKGGLIVSCYAGPDFNAEMGVPQTMVCVAKSCIAGGARAIRTNWENVAAVKAAVDGTIRDRYDDKTLEQFIRAIKQEFGTFVIADISTVEEGVAAWNYGADMVGTTLSGYTPYSKNPLPFGTLPSPEPDYEIIRELRAAGVEHIVAEGRITNGEKMKKALEAGAHSVVIGTSITEPRKIVKTILMDAGL